MKSVVKKKNMNHPDKRVKSYSQSKDPTFRLFIKGDEDFVSEKAMLRQIKNLNVNASNIRVSAQKSLNRRFGSGLDEGIPTDQRNLVAKSNNVALIGAQSGLRGRTDLTLLKSNDGKVAGHTGFFRQSSRVSTNTSGQSSAHDIRRKDLEDISKLPHAEAFSRVVHNYIKSLADGRSIITSHNITDGKPNYIKYGVIEDPSHTQPKNRILLAQDAHEARETVKRRLSRYESENNFKRSSSPERTKINSDGSGGDYIKQNIIKRSDSPIRKIDGVSGSVEYYANMAAYMTESLR